MSSPNERPGFSSTCTMKGESAMVALLSYALRREQRALSWCRVSGEGTNVVRYRTIIRMTRGFLGIRQIPALMAAVSVRPAGHNDPIIGQGTSITLRDV